MRYRDSYIVAMDEFWAEGRGDESDESALGRNIRTFGGQWDTLRGFAAYVTWLISDGIEETPRSEGYVPQTTFWWVEGDDYLGSIRVRHALTHYLATVGGHVGYDVRPTARGQGHATAMLHACLPFAASIGIREVLVTCDADNVASRKVIEANGGRPDGEIEGKLRYWVATDA